MISSSYVGDCNQSSLRIYMDESGTLAAPSATEQFYVIAAVICKETNLESVLKIADELKLKEYKDGELKSSKVGNDEERRKRILKHLSQLSIVVDFLIVDKKYAYEKYPGAKFRNSFFKYLRKELLNYIRVPGCSIEVVMDEFGRYEFMDSTIDYLKKQFSDNFLKTFQFSPSQDNHLVQIADFFAGSCRRYLESGSNDALKIASGVIGRFVSIADYLRFPNEAYTENPNDTIITRISLGHIMDFQNKYAASDDDDEKIMCFICEQLYLIFLQNAKKYTYASTFRRRIEEQFKVKITDHKFKSMIADIRDKGVIIATSSRGYKLPSSLHDLKEFTQHVSSITIPYLERLEHARDIFRTGTGGEIDFLDEEEFLVIRELVNALKNTKPASFGAWSKD